jgi:hypothetical protein
LNRVSFALIIHAHQPVGNFDHVVEEAYQKSYAPFLQALWAHPRIRVSLHYSGILLEWIEKRHREYFDQLRALCERGQIELVGGGYYEPILPVIPDADKAAQLGKLGDYLEQIGCARPRGAWVAERVWEPCLARPLSQAGIEYVVLDDTHFLAAGLEPAQLRGVYITEDAGLPLRLVPSLKDLRYTIPFRDIEETLQILRAGAGQNQPLFAVGDDLEKFGVWPGTYDHVYAHGWLERFLKALEEAQDWLDTTTVADYVSAHAPVGRIYLPTASYAEMMEWALPSGVSADFKRCLEESERMAAGDHFRRFMRGGFWRNFLSKYPEANQLHKLMLNVSRRWQETRAAGPWEGESARLLEEAQTHLLASQCNDAYWHGIFGGLYAPHLRSALLRHLIQAESLLDQMGGSAQNPSVRVKHEDFDVDGYEEVLVEQRSVGMIVRPADGGTVSSLRFKPLSVELVNSLMRRSEAYHDLVRHRVASKEAPHEGPASIHDMVLSKESNLDALLRYDRYARYGFRSYLFPASKSFDDFAFLRLEEDGTLAQAQWKLVARTPSGKVDLQCATETAAGCDSGRIEARKTLTSKTVGQAWHLECRSTLSAERPCPSALALGLEMIFNLLAPDAPDRYFLANEVRRPLEFRGEIIAPTLVLVDEWQRVKITLETKPQARWWIVPIETISQSELGFERVYQGSAILVVWKIDPPSWRNITCLLRAEIEAWSASAAPEDSTT